MVHHVSIVLHPRVVSIALQPRRLVSIIRQGAKGEDGAGAADFVHTQSPASAEWIINHNFGYEPVVTVLSTGGVEMDAQIVHVSSNQSRVYFVTAQAGKARCV